MDNIESKFLENEILKIKNWFNEITQNIDLTEQIKNLNKIIAYIDEIKEKKRYLFNSIDPKEWKGIYAFEILKFKEKIIYHINFLSEHAPFINYSYFKNIDFIIDRIKDRFRDSNWIKYHASYLDKKYNNQTELSKEFDVNFKDELIKNIKIHATDYKQEYEYLVRFCLIAKLNELNFKKDLPKTYEYIEREINQKPPSKETDHKNKTLNDLTVPQLALYYYYLIEAKKMLSFDNVQHYESETKIKAMEYVLKRDGIKKGVDGFKNIYYAIGRGTNKDPLTKKNIKPLLKILKAEAQKTAQKEYDNFDE